MRQSVHQIIRIRPGRARRRPDHRGLRVEIEPARILLVLPVNNVTDGLATLLLARALVKPAIIKQRNGVERLEIGIGDQLAPGEIIAHLAILARIDAKCHARAGRMRRPVETENKARHLARPPVMPGTEAEGSAKPVKPRQPALDKIKARLPHQGAIAKYPEIAALHAVLCRSRP